MIHSAVLALVLTFGQPGQKDLVQMPPPVYVLSCYRWSLMVEAISHLGKTPQIGFSRFMTVYQNVLSDPLKRFAFSAYEFVGENNLSGTKGDLAFNKAMLDCDGYRML